MHLAQFALLLVIFVLLWFALHHRSSTEARAFRRIAFLGLTVIIVLAVLFPDTLTALANIVGIGRGADLVIYLVAIGLLFFAVSVFLKFGDMDRRLTLLARHIALLENSGTVVNPEREPKSDDS